ncbi:HlyD family secretion protein [Fodinibius roseus]|uniref:HlyD family secretion protein n=1 Tax=Fodinibius roseus TaxID=1194090 RepID=A0A1M4UG41_9BACT|nr:efflux RND transporter periplasmic adaptor subunit [Fodinibius roseus]SHE55598.1 HlyD family secretion protein [Fodinibius roseus]
MNTPTRKQIILIIAGILIVAVVAYGFFPGAVTVETATVQPDSLQVTVEEEGRTQVKEHYRLSSPVTAYLRRIDLEEGVTVEAGDPVVQLEPPRSTMLDPRSQAEARARVEAAEASLEEAETRAEQAARERDRVARLAGGGSATQRQLENARTEATRATAALNAARAELAAARAALHSTDDGSGSQPESYVLRAPVTGSVLTIHRKSEGPVNAGEPLIEIGNIDSLEVRVDLLSEDAVRIAPGMRVVLAQWGGETPLEASVTRVEHQGEVEVSALGVEEQRVEVIAELESPPEKWNRLGSGYRVLARFIVWEGENVLQVPTSALFRTGEGWGVFAVQDGEAVRRTVKVGRQTGLSAQVLEGLSEGDEVIVHPGSEIEDGVKIESN